MIESLLFLFTGIIGVFTLAIMIRSYRSNHFCNFFLVLIISIVSFRFIINGSYYLELQNLIKPVKGVYLALYLVVFPATYLYYKNLIFQNVGYRFKDLKHLSFIVFLYLLNTSLDLENSFLSYFGLMTNFYLISAFVIFYLALIFNMLSKNIWFKKNLLLSKDHFVLVKNWTLFFFIINIICSVFLLITIYDEVNNGFLISGKTFSIFRLVLWLSVFVKILISPEILYGLPILNKTLLKFKNLSSENKEEINDVVPIVEKNWVLETKSKKNNQDQRLQENIKDHILSYINEVDKLSSEELIFRDPKASQNSIAKTLGVPTSHIVYLFKYHSKITFSEYRMNSRIQDAIILIKQGFLNSETFESLAYKTGFASYNPFFSAFKKITKHSPQEYIKLIKR